MQSMNLTNVRVDPLQQRFIIARPGGDVHLSFARCEEKTKLWALCVGRMDLVPGNPSAPPKGSVRAYNAYIECRRLYEAAVLADQASRQPTTRRLNLP